MLEVAIIADNNTLSIQGFLFELLFTDLKKIYK